MMTDTQAEPEQLCGGGGGGGGGVLFLCTATNKAILRAIN